jgi:hypothetical protein
MDAEKMKLLREFKRWTEIKLLTGVTLFSCKRGLFSIAHANRETAEEKALIEFEKYYSAGEYK